MSAFLIFAIRKLIVELVARNYAAIIADGRGGLLTESEIASAIAQYGRTLTVPAESALQVVDEYPEDNAPGQSWIDVPLWTNEEGRSDLTLSIIAAKRGEKHELRIQDLHVL